MSVSLLSGQGVRSFLWGAAHALDLGGVLLQEKDWGGLESDAQALRGDWQVAVHFAERSLRASEAGEAE
jgi:hypothetical protein